MTQLQIRFPRLCAWCGTRPPSAARKVNVQHSRGRRTSRLRFEAPICETCEAHAAALQKASNQRSWGAIIGSLVVGFLLSLLLFGLRDSANLVIMGIFFGFVLMSFVLIVMSIGKLKMWFNQRMVGEPPEAYASNDYQPCKMVDWQKLSFYSNTYHTQFAALNPGLVK